jgi:hypothetical protein
MNARTMRSSQGTNTGMNGAIFGGKGTFDICGGKATKNS